VREAKICPCCGTDIALDEPIVINDFSMLGAGRPLFYRDVMVSLTHGEALICWSLMKAYPGFLTLSAIAERISERDLEAPDNLVRVLVCRIRKKLRDLGAPVPIVTLSQHHAYEWDPRAQ
jgi:DNA-binding response OmpR family regulator